MKNLFDRVPEEDKRLYTIIPLGFTKNGKAAYIRIPHDHAGQFVGAMVWTAFRESSNISDFVNLLNQNFPYSFGSIHPALESLLHWHQFAEGQNPQDWYSGHGVIPKRVWDSDDGLQKTLYMLKSTWNNLGGRVLMNFDTDSIDEISTFYERATGYPLIGDLLRRFGKVSDYGLQEEGQRRQKKVLAAKQTARNKRDKVIEQYIREDPLADPRDITQKLIKDGFEHGYKSRRALLNRVKQLQMRLAGDPFERLKSWASTDEEREIFEKMRREDLGIEEE